MPTLSVNGIDVHYRVEGEGPALLLVHNVIANIDTFARNFQALSKHYRVIACDHRGHGKTSKVPASERSEAFYDFDLIAQDISGVLDHLGVKEFFVLGQAYWGVSVSLTLFLKWQKRVLGIVAASCNLIASGEGENPYDGLGEEARENFVRMQDIARTQGMIALFEERKRIATFWSKRLLANQQILDEFAEMYEVTCPEAFCNFPKVSPARYREICAALNETGVPLLMLMGAEDSHNDSMIASMKSDYSNSQILLIPAAGHYPAIENPESFNSAALNFFAGCRLYNGK
jgi:pimeloyl-ACP methyl ester carboxylesterase